MHESVSAMYNCDFETRAERARRTSTRACLTERKRPRRGRRRRAALPPLLPALYGRVDGADPVPRHEQRSNAQRRQEEIWNVVMYDSANAASVQQKRDYLQENMAQ